MADIIQTFVKELTQSTVDLSKIDQELHSLNLTPQQLNTLLTDLRRVPDTSLNGFPKVEFNYEIKQLSALESEERIPGRETSVFKDYVPITSQIVIANKPDGSSETTITYPSGSAYQSGIVDRDANGDVIGGTLTGSDKSIVKIKSISSSNGFTLPDNSVFDINGNWHRPDGSIITPEANVTKPLANLVRLQGSTGTFEIAFADDGKSIKSINAEDNGSVFIDFEHPENSHPKMNKLKNGVDLVSADSTDVSISDVNQGDVHTLTLRYKTNPAIQMQFEVVDGIVTVKDAADLQSP